MNPIPADPYEQRRATIREGIWLLPNVAKLLARIVRDRRVSVRSKAFAAAVLVYVISPIDIIPDFIIGFGKLDDLILSAVAIQHLVESAGEDIVTEHWDGSEASLKLILNAAEMGAEIIPAPIRKMLPS